MLVKNFYNQNREVTLLLLFFAAVRIAIAGTNGLGVDEAHYALYARFLDYSYYDHPPLIGWFLAPFYYLLPKFELFLRLPFIAVWGWIGFLVYGFILEHFRNKKQALIAVVLLHFSFIPFGIGIFFTPDSLLVLWGLLIVRHIHALFNGFKTRDFIVLGLCFGLAGLTKYSAIFFAVAFLALFLIEKKFIFLLKQKHFYTMTGLALALVSPVFIWNAQHNWISFIFQFNHVQEGQKSILNFLKTLVVWFAAYNPLLSWLSVYAFWQLFKQKPKSLIERIWIVFAIVFIAGFIFFALSPGQLPHWVAFFFVLTLPLGYVYLQQNITEKGTQRFKALFHTALALFAFLSIELVFKLIPLPDYSSYLKNIKGVKSTIAQIKKLDPQNKNLLAVSHWTLASRFAYYSGKEAFVLDDYQGQFDFFFPLEKARNKDLLIVSSYFLPLKKQSIKCINLELEKMNYIYVKNRLVNSYKIYKCENFQGLNR